MAKPKNYLSHISHVIAEPKHKFWVIALGMVFVFCVGLIIWLLNPRERATPKHQAVHQQDEYVISQNLRQLAKLQQDLNHQFHVAAKVIEQDPVLIKRQHAPTQMYQKQNLAPRSPDKLAETAVATVLKHPSNTIVAGELLHGILETAINSDLEGIIRAVLTTPAYSYVGHQLLLPAGSRLIGQYQAKADNGGATARVFVVWERIITPSGISIVINSPGTDQLGKAGIGADHVDHHFWQIFGQATLLSLLGATSANYGVSSNDQYNSSSQYRSAMAEALQQTGSDMVQQNVTQIKPTLHIQQGKLINIFVAQDVDLSSVVAQ